MPALYQAVITEKGLNLRAKAEAGKYGIEFTKAVTGSGEYSGNENLHAAESLKNPIQEFGFSKREYVNDATSMLQVIITNAGLQEGYYVREIGVFARDPDEGEILYSLSLAEDNKWDYLPEYEWGAAMIELEIETAVANAEKVTVMAKMDALASADDLNSLREPEFEDYSMPEAEIPDIEESVQMIRSGRHLRLLMQYIKASLVKLLEFDRKLNAGENVVEFEDYNGNEDEVPDPEEAIRQIASGKTDKVFRQYVKASLKGLLNLAQKAFSIAAGKNQARVFATVEALDAWLAVPANVQQLKVGDNFYIIATDVPDYWWDGTQKQKLETQKVDLTTYDQRIAANASAINELNGNLASHKVSSDHDGRYYTETEVNNLLTWKSDTSHSHTWDAITGKPGTFASSDHNHDSRYYTETEVNNLLTALITTKNYETDNVEIAANDIYYFTRDVSLSGYKPLAVAKYILSNAGVNGANSSYTMAYGWLTDGNTAKLQLKNLRTDAKARIRVVITILYVKN